ncbi:hypothetical protein F1640_15140 [Novosphingobium sp. NBM11]|uniref:hypothetical protein n=1 Tax=Novosphingobium sp. NBM11 TaxID=2596914 RepID=UPI0018921E99|nr:hypothetical protein [Novosphingobium sp. NBM11]MBF5091321.1 hypothetical protein [Novosphingobium sp. NBM11]
MSKELIAATEREIADWHGVTMTHEPDGGKHGRISLHYAGNSRLVIIAKTPGDHRALPNHLAIVRRELRALGAEKARIVVGKPKAERPFKPLIPATHKPLEALETVIMQTKNTEQKFKAIFDGIEDLRYGEMLHFADLLRKASIAMKLRRSEVHSWARTLQFAVNAHEHRSKS